MSAKRGRDDGDAYDYDSEDDGNTKKKSKKTGAAPKGKANGSDKLWELSSGRNPRRVEISQFKDVHLINIREYYEKNDEYLPGKKGISLTIDQYKALVKAIPEINASLKEEGIEVDGSAEAMDEDGDESDEDDERDEKKSRRKVKAKREKANIEETSDEEE